MDENNKKHIEELREYYKNKPQKSSNFLKVENSESKKSFFDNIKNNPKTQNTNMALTDGFSNFKNNIIKYLLVTFIFALVSYLAVLLIDSFIIESLVHNRATIRVPNVIGKSLSEAQEILTSNNLNYEYSMKQFDMKESKGTIVRQIPAPGQLIKEQRLVYLTLSNGVEKIVTPNLINLTQRKARVELLNSGLLLGSVNEVNSESVESGNVISQNPPPGTNLKFNDKVNIIISLGSKNQIILPNFTMMTLEEVKEKLALLELKVGSITYVQDETYQDGIILGQFPLADEPVLKNSFIDLEVVKN